MVDINSDTLLEWNKDPEFSGAIKKAVSARLLKRLKRIECGANGWQRCAWLAERLLPSRYAKPEVQISLNSIADEANDSRVLTISLEKACQSKERAVPIRESPRLLLEEYERNRASGYSSPSRELERLTQPPSMLSASAR